MLEKDKRLIEENWDKLEVTIKSLILKFNIDKGEMEDYKQTGLLALCNKAHKYDGSTKFTTFANTVICNAFIDKYRRDKLRKIDTVSIYGIYAEDSEGGTTALMDYLAAENDTENEVLSGITNAMVRKYIKNAKNKSTARTTVKGFEALELKLEGYSGEDIAKLFDVPSNSLRSWMSRAKKTLLSEREFVELIRN